MKLQLDAFASPLGEILLVHDEAGALRALDFEDHAARMRRLLGLHYGEVELLSAGAPPGTRDALQRYFGGALGALETIPVATGGTVFQRRVWSALRTIPAGRTLSYGALAAGIGAPKAMRAVGLANGANPVAIIVPCHRVVGANGALTGFGGGLHRKRWLLEHEGALARGEAAASERPRAAR
jgi:methylated-DNA-[protein]-cysteine S-methyltransferase